MNSLRGNFRGSSASSVRPESATLSLRELMEREFPLESFIRPGGKHMPKLMHDEPRGLASRKNPLLSQKDHDEKMNMTTFANSMFVTGSIGNQPTHRDTFASERQYPNQEFRATNVNRSGETGYGSFDNRAQSRYSDQEQFMSYERQGGCEEKSKTLNLSEYVNKLYASGENLSEYVNKLYVSGEDNFDFAVNSNTTRTQKKTALCKTLPVVKDLSKSDTPDYVKNLLAKVLNREKTQKRENEANNKVADMKKTDVPDYVKNLIDKVLSREDRQESGNDRNLRKRESEDGNQFQPEKNSGKQEFGNYVHQLYARIANDREKILKYEDLVKRKDTVNSETNEKEEDLEKNHGNLQNTQSHGKEIWKLGNSSGSKDKDSAENLGNVQCVQSFEKAVWKYGETSSVTKADMEEQRYYITSSCPPPPEFPSLHQLMYQPWKEYIRMSPSRSRSRSPRRRRKKSPGMSPGRIRSRSYGRIRSRSPGRVRSRSPVRIRSRSPGSIRSRSPGRIRSGSPGRIRSRSPGRFRSRSPVRIRSRSPVRIRSRSPGRIKSRSPKRYRSRSPNSLGQESRTQKSSNTLIGVLKLLISTIKKTNTVYTLEILQDNSAVDFFCIPSALKVCLLISGFQLKLCSSPNAHGYPSDVLRDVLKFSQENVLDHEVYVEAKAHEDSIDIHDVRAYELAEYFRDADVLIDFKTLDETLVKKFQQTSQVDRWSHMHSAQNKHSPSKPSAFRRLGKHVRAYELAEYFRDAGVLSDFKTLDENLVKKFQQTSQADRWSPVHRTQNKLGPSKPSVFSRLGK